MPELHRRSVFVFQDLVMFKMQRANRTELAVLAQCGAANLADPFTFCFHDRELA